MKICVVTATYPMEGFGGIFVKEQCEQLAANGNEVCVLYCSELQKAVKDIRIHLKEENGVRIIYSCLPRYATTYAPRFWCGVMGTQLDKLYKRMLEQYGRPDVIYAHFSFPAGRIATELGKRENIPVVIAEHWSGLINGRAKGTVLSFIKEALTAADSVICVSSALKDAVLKLLPSAEKVSVIPNMLSNAFSYRLREEKDTFVFFSLGTLNEKKQFGLLIESFAEAFSPEDKVVLRIGGSGPDEARLRQLITDKQRTAQITLLGKLDREQTVGEYAGCDAFVLLSPKETFGIAYREAMAVGRPVISPDNGGIRYNWDDKNGMIVGPCDENIRDRVVAAMQKMVASIGDYDLKGISDATMAEYSAVTVSKRIEGVLLAARDRVR